MRELNKVGIVGVHDAGVNADGIELYKRLVATDDWSVRVYAMIDCMAGHNHFCPDEAEEISFDKTGNKLAVRSVKLFAGKFYLTEVLLHYSSPWLGLAWLIFHSAGEDLPKFLRRSLGKLG